MEPEGTVGHLFPGSDRNLMPRNLVVASLIAIFTAAAAPAMARTAPPVLCPDTYCGQRPYADPYIWHAFRRTPGYGDYGRSAYLLRTLRPIYVDTATYEEYRRTGYLPARYLKRHYRHDTVRTNHRTKHGHRATRKKLRTHRKG